MASTGALDVKVAVVGIRDTMRALRTLNPEAAKELRQELGAAGRLIVNAAKQRVPVSRPLLDSSGRGGWRNVWAMNGRVRGGQGWPAWYTSEIKREIKLSKAATDRSRKDKTRTTIAATTQNPAANIYEFAKSNHTAGRFSGRLPSYMGGRIMWAGNDAVANQVNQKINDAVVKAQSIVQASVNSAKV